MKRKTKQILGAVIALVLVFGGMAAWRYFAQDNEDKTLQISIVVDKATIYEASVDTNAGTLADLLKEMAENQEIQLEYSQSAFGMYIQGLGSKEILYREDPNSGKYWVYDSKNNAQCAKNSFCDAADQLLIEDGDVFIFTLAAYEG